MKITVATLKLPNPSETLIQMFNDCVAALELTPSQTKQKNDLFQANLYNTALHGFKGRTNLPEEFIAKVKSEYQGFLHNHYITAQVGVIAQTGDTPSCEPPHFDKLTKFAITFFVDLGGDSVSTVFYNQVRTNFTDGQAIDLKYAEVTEVCRANLTSNNWYCYPTDWAHGVENITGKRCLLIIRFDPLDSNYTIENFMNDYPELIDEIVIDKEMVTNDNGVIVAQN